MLRSLLENLLVVQSRYVPAAGRAIAAGADAFLHILKRFAVLFTGLAYLGAQRCKPVVKLAFAPQRVCCEGA